jgi:hypothetical protein
MQKFLSIPVTSEQEQLVSCVGVALVEQQSTTQVDIHYTSGKTIRLTHGTAPAGDESMRDKIEDEIILALQQAWRDVTKAVENLPFAVSGIAAV